MSEATTSGSCTLCGASHGITSKTVPKHGAVPLCRSCRSLWGDDE